MIDWVKVRYLPAGSTAACLAAFFFFLPSPSSFQCNLWTSFQYNESFKRRSRFICGFSCRLWVAERFDWAVIDWPQVRSNGRRSLYWGNIWCSIERQWQGKRAPFILWRWGSVDNDPSATLVLINCWREVTGNPFKMCENLFVFSPLLRWLNVVISFGLSFRHCPLSLSH